MPKTPVFSALLLLSACTHLAGVEQGIRAHRLAGDWRSERGDHFLIGCSGAFNADLVLSASPPVDSHETGAHVSEVAENGFTVSHWPMASDHYDVAEWPKKDPQGRVVMTAEGMKWSRTQEIDCD